MIERYESCPKCRKTLTEKLVKECAFCGLIFEKYNKKKNIDYESCLKEIHCLSSASDVLSKFCKNYPEESDRLDEIVDKIDMTVFFINHKHDENAKKYLDDLLKSATDLRAVVGKELDKFYKGNEASIIVGQGIKELANGNYDASSKLFDQAESLGFNKQELQPYRNEISTKIIERIKARTSGEADLMSSRDNLLTCSNCGYSSPQMIKEGYKAGRGIAGALIFGPIGALLGAVNSNKLYNVCPRCGSKWSINY